MDNFSAWRLQVADNVWIGLAETAVLEYLGSVSPWFIPGAKPGWSYLLPWRGKKLPVLDLQSWQANQQTFLASQRIVVVTIEVDGAMELIGLAVKDTPTRININDDQFCDDISLIGDPILPLVRSLIETSGEVTALVDLSVAYSSQNQPFFS